MRVPLSSRFPQIYCWYCGTVQVLGIFCIYYTFRNSSNLFQFRVLLQLSKHWNVQLGRYETGDAYYENKNFYGKQNSAGHNGNPHSQTVTQCTFNFLISSFRQYRHCHFYLLIVTHTPTNGVIGRNDNATAIWKCRGHMKKFSIEECLPASR